MKTKNEVPCHKVIVRLEKVDRWTGLSEAARLTGRTPTQIKRHVTGERPSRKLAEDMDRLGILVETGDKTRGM